MMGSDFREEYGMEIVGMYGINYHCGAGRSPELNICVNFAAYNTSSKRQTVYAIRIQCNLSQQTSRHELFRDSKAGGPEATCARISEFAAAPQSGRTSGAT